MQWKYICNKFQFRINLMHEMNIYILIIVLNEFICCEPSSLLYLLAPAEALSGSRGSLKLRWPCSQGELGETSPRMSEAPGELCTWDVIKSDNFYLLGIVGIDRNSAWKFARDNAQVWRERWVQVSSVSVCLHWLIRMTDWGQIISFELRSVILVKVI